MKEIAILLENEKRDYPAGLFIKQNLEEVLEDTVHIRLCFLEDTERFYLSSADLILVMVHRLIHEAYSRISDFYNKGNVLFVSRTISRDALQRANEIPAGEKVLVVNQSQNTVMETMRLLYQLGVMHLNLVPYTPEIDFSEFRYAITPGVWNIIPECDTKVIDIGYRQLDCYAFIDIISHLGIKSDRITRNLFRYSQTLPSKHTDVEKWYLSSQMTDKTLEKVMGKIDFGILVTDINRKVLYCNPKTRDIFQCNVKEDAIFEVPTETELVDRLFEENFRDELIRSGDDPIVVERYHLSNEDDTMGYYFEFHTAKGISNLGNKLSKKLRESGLYAKFTFDDITYLSPEMKKCLDVAKKLSATNFSILISGESGSGKEMVAQSIHNASMRCTGPFIAVNCAAFPETLLESELFGYEGGAFTGSKREGKAGLFELANKGTIFLDEIGDMPLSIQAKLLRVLQEKRIMRVGSNKVTDIDIRVLSASNKNLKAEIENKQFRADLYYRLSTFTIEIPPLRNRKEDILPLFYTFVTNRNMKLPDAEEQQLLQYAWPGNVRELQNVAAYFDVIGDLGALDSSYGGSPERKPSTMKAIKEKILVVLRRYPDLGLGRQRILALLREEGMSVSEKRFEAVIKELLQEKRILRGRGRAGIRLAPES